MNLPYPKHPGATYSQLRIYQNQYTRWHAINRGQPDADTQLNILNLIDTAHTFKEIWDSYRLAETAGMVYFQLSDKPGESEHVWI